MVPHSWHSRISSVIKRYNMSDLYALFVGNLGDRMAGGGEFPHALGRRPAAVRQEHRGDPGRLQTLGYAVAKIDGKAGMNTRSLIGAYQKANSLKIDCWPTEALLEHVRVKAPAKGAEAGKGRQGETMNGRLRVSLVPGAGGIGLGRPGARRAELCHGDASVHRQALAGGTGARHLPSPVRARNRRLHSRS